MQSLKAQLKQQGAKSTLNGKYRHAPGFSFFERVNADGRKRTSLYEDIVTNETLAEQYRQYMIQYLGMTPKTMLSTAEALVAFPQAGSS